MRPDIDGFISAKRTGNQTWRECPDESFVVDIIQKMRSGFPIGKDELLALRLVADRAESLALTLSFQDEYSERVDRMHQALGEWPRYQRDLGLLPGDILLEGMTPPKGELLPAE